MLKIIKNEYKSVIIVPAMGLIAGIIYLIVKGIQVAVFDSFGGYSSALTIGQTMADVFLYATLVITIGVFVSKSVKSADIYKLTDVKDWQIIGTRMLMLFVIVAVMTLYYECIFSIEQKLCMNKYGAETMTDWFYWGNYALCNRPFASWLYFLAKGLSAVLFYTMALSSASLLRLNELNRFIRYPLAVGLILVVALGFFATAPIITNWLSFADFNIGAEGRYLIPNGVYVFNAGKGFGRKDFFTINIFSLGELFFTVIYIGFCLLIYSLGYRKSNDVNVVTFRKKQISLVAVVTLFVVGTSIFLGVTTAVPKELKGYTAHYRYYEAEGKVGEDIDLSQFKLDKYYNLKNFSVKVDYSSYPPEDSTPEERDGWIYSTDAVRLSDDGRTAHVTEAGDYMIHVNIDSKFTHNGYYRAISLKITE